VLVDSCISQKIHSGNSELSDIIYVCSSGSSNISEKQDKLHNPEQSTILHKTYP